jgi:hypothetical protein
LRFTLGETDRLVGELPGERRDQRRRREIARRLEPLFPAAAPGFDGEDRLDVRFGALHVLHVILEFGRIEAEKARIVPDVSPKVDRGYVSGIAALDGSQRAGFDP